MMTDPLQARLELAVQRAFQQLFDAEVTLKQIGFQPTRPEFEGDVTMNVFPFLKLTGKAESKPSHDE